MPQKPDYPELKETKIYEKLDKERVRCGICGQRCEIEPFKRGFCKVRRNIKGKLYSLVYGKAIQSSIDPIEKKPLFHFAPGSKVMSIATVGCNLGCLFCQNWEISQEFGHIQEEFHSPEDIITRAKNTNCQGIAYTYTEPAVFYEYVYDTAKESGSSLFNIMVSNGYFTPESVKKISSYIDAVNIDLKGDYRFYKKYCFGKKGDEPVKESLKALKEEGIWTEITNMIIPGLNDDEGFTRNMCKWIVENLGREVPLHFSKFYPNYKMTNIEATPTKKLENAREIARKEGLKYVYIGNMPGHRYENTFCQGCGNVVIKRHGLSLEEFNMDKNFRCVKCGEKIPIEGKNWVKRDFFKK